MSMKKKEINGILIFCSFVFAVIIMTSFVSASSIIPVVQSGDPSTSGYKFSNMGNTDYYVGVGNGDRVYCVYWRAYGTNTPYQCYLISKSPFTYITVSNIVGGNIHNFGNNYSSSTSLDGYDIYYSLTSIGQYSYDSNVTLYCDNLGIFYNMYEFLNAGIEYLDGIASVTYSNINFELPAGNIAYIKVPDELVIYHLTETMRELSPLFASGWSDVYQYVGIVDSLPQSGDTLILPENSDQSIFKRINWKKGENTNFFGQTKDAWSSDSIRGENGYLVIYNPAYYYSVNNNATSYWNSNINIEVNKAADVYVFNVDDGTINVPPSIGDYEGIYTPDGWVDSNGDPTLPPEIGGGNYVPSGDDEESVLNGLVSRIERIFSGLWSHIKRIVDSLGEVPSQIGQLFQWLPEDMTSIIISLFSIIIIVGVLKVLL